MHGMNEWQRHVHAYHGASDEVDASGGSRTAIALHCMHGARNLGDMPTQVDGHAVHLTAGTRAQLQAQPQIVVVDTQDLGREVLVVGGDVQAGTLLLESRAYAHVLSARLQLHICTWCLGRAEPMMRYLTHV